MYVCMIDVVMI